MQVFKVQRTSYMLSIHRKFITGVLWIEYLNGFSPDRISSTGVALSSNDGKHNRPSMEYKIFLL